MIVALAISPRLRDHLIMRLVGALLATLLATSAAYADKVPFEIVRMLPETQQVLVYDRAHNTHVLLQPGSQFDDYVVIEVSGIEMTVEKQQQRFTVYPREAQHLALNLLPRDPGAAPLAPVIYGKSAPVPAPTLVADAKADAKMIETKANEAKTLDAKKTQVAREFALVLADSPPRVTRAALPSPVTPPAAPSTPKR
jgi:hypothetical protein